MNILVLHGPNLNLLGEREPHIYGTTTLEEINTELDRRASEVGHDLKIYQSNWEGKLIDLILDNRRWTDILIFNPGAFTHYSYALRDAVAAVNKPMIEVHLSDPTKREEWRKKSVFEDLHDVTRIMGMGVNSYYAALDAAFARA
jgi:3-dehydroquinate dehydratase II